MLYAGYRTGLAFWRGNPDADPGSFERGEPFVGVPRRASEIILDDASSIFLNSFDMPDLLVPSKEYRCRPRHYAYSEYSGELPGRSFVRVADQLCVPSPEMCFALAARTVQLEELMELGNELCGTYSRPAVAGQGDIVQRKGPLATPDSIRELLSCCEGRGVVRAQSALEYVLPRSASPMETAVMLLLCLPVRRGGYGLPLPEFNARIDFHGRSRAVARRGFARCDLFWNEANLDVEYNGRPYHEGELEYASDSDRIEALKMEGVEVITLARSHVLHLQPFEVKVRQIYQVLGKRWRTPARKQLEKRDSLRRLLL